MTEHQIDSLDDPRLAPFTTLTDVALRLRREPAEGIFIAEGTTVIERALAAGHEPVSALLSQKWLPKLRDSLGDAQIDLFVGTEDQLRQVTGFRLHRGALVSFKRWALPTATEVLSGAKTVIVLEGLVDHTNVGLVFRSAAGLGADAILVSPTCADPLYRRSVKVSMGAVFSVPWAKAEPWPWVLDDLRAEGFELLALTPDPTAVDVRSYQRSRRIGLVVGSEGPGLSRTVLERVSTRLRIPMANGVDSLNVATAAAIACFAVSTGEQS